VPATVGDEENGGLCWSFCHRGPVSAGDLGILGVMSRQCCFLDFGQFLCKPEFQRLCAEVCWIELSAALPHRDSIVLRLVASQVHPDHLGQHIPYAAISETSSNC